MSEKKPNWKPELGELVRCTFDEIGEVEKFESDGNILVRFRNSAPTLLHPSNVHPRKD